MRNAVFAGTALVLLSSTLATPLAASPVPPARPAAAGSSPGGTAAKPTSRPLAAASLYSRRSRRLVQSYLRLKLLEMRERDLGLARKVIERKIGVGALLNETPAPRPR